MIGSGRPPSPRPSPSARRGSPPSATAWRWSASSSPPAGCCSRDPIRQGAGDVVPGFSDQRELELLVAAGFSPLEAIRIGTLNGAIYEGLGRSYWVDRAGQGRRPPRRAGVTPRGASPTSRTSSTCSRTASRTIRASCSTQCPTITAGLLTPVVALFGGSDLGVLTSYGPRRSLRRSPLKGSGIASRPGRRPRNPAAALLCRRTGT